MADPLLPGSGVPARGIAPARPAAVGAAAVGAADAAGSADAESSERDTEAAPWCTADGLRYAPGNLSGGTMPPDAMPSTACPSPMVSGVLSGVVVDCASGASMSTNTPHDGQVRLPGWIGRPQDQHGTGPPVISTPPARECACVCVSFRVPDVATFWKPPSVPARSAAKTVAGSTGPLPRLCRRIRSMNAQRDAAGPVGAARFRRSRRWIARRRRTR